MEAHFLGMKFLRVLLLKKWPSVRKIDEDAWSNKFSGNSNEFRLFIQHLYKGMIHDAKFQPQLFMIHECSVQSRDKTNLKNE